MWVLLILALILLISYPALHGPPVYDDVQYFGPDFKKFPPFSLDSALKRMFMNWTIAATWKWVKDPFHVEAFHLTHSFLHFLNTLIVYRIASSLGFESVECVMAALLFAVHPLAMSAIAPIATRSALLSGTFVLLSVWVTLAGYPVLAFPLILIGFTAKDDAISALPLVIVLTAFRSPKEAAVLSAAVLIAVLCFLKPLLEIYQAKIKHNGDEAMSNAGIGDSLPQPIATLTAMTANLFQAPLWIIGLGQCVDPDPKPVSLRSWRFWVAVLALLLVVGIALTASFPMRVALAIIFISPWTVTWLIRLPDTIGEHRTYTALAGLALLLSPLSHYPWLATLVIGWLAFRSTIRAYWQREQIPYWLSAWNQGSHKLRVALNIGSAYQGIGNLVKAKEWHENALQIDPNNGITLANMGLWHEGMCRVERLQMSNKFIFNGMLDETEANESIAKSRAHLEKAVEFMKIAIERCPKDPLVQKFTVMVCEHAVKSGIPVTASPNAESL